MAVTDRIQRINRSAPKADLIRALELDGCVIITEFTDATTLVQAHKEVQPYLDSNELDSKVGGKSRNKALIPNSTSYP